MPATFTCQHADPPDDGIMRIILALDRGQTNYAHFNVSRDVLSEMGAETMTAGDEVDVQFVVRPRGGNGMQQR